MDSRKTLLLLAGLAAILLLEAYSVFFSAAYLPQEGPTVRQLLENASFYEGKRITLLYVQVKRHEITHLVVSEAGEKEQLAVNLSPQDAQAVKQGDLLAITGVSRVDSNYTFDAEKVHVYANIWWRPVISLAGLAFLIALALREKPWKESKNNLKSRKAFF